MSDVVDRYGLRLTQSKIDAISQLSAPSSFEQLRLPLAQRAIFASYSELQHTSKSTNSAVPEQASKRSHEHTIPSESAH